VLPEDAIDQCFHGSEANPRYGLAFWLARAKGGEEVVYASGSAGQALYVVPPQELVVARFGASSSWRHETFLRALLG